MLDILVNWGNTLALSATAESAPAVTSPQPSKPGSPAASHCSPAAREAYGSGCNSQLERATGLIGAGQNSQLERATGLIGAGRNSQIERATGPVLREGAAYELLVVWKEAPQPRRRRRRLFALERLRPGQLARRFGFVGVLFTGCGG